MSRFFDKLTDRLAELAMGRRSSPTSTPAPVADEQPTEDAGTPTPKPKQTAEQRAAFVREATIRAGLVPKPQRFDGPWPLESVLMDFRSLVMPAMKREALIPFTLDDATKGIWVYGGTGSGKSSGSGKHIAYAMLRAGFGGVVLTDKAEETDAWVEYAKTCGREQDLIVFSGREVGGKATNEERPANKYIPKECGFNFLEYEIAASPSNPALAATDLLMELVGANNSHAKDPIWERATHTLIGNAILLCSLSGLPITLKRLLDMINDAKKLQTVVDAGKARIDRKELTASQVEDFEEAFQYMGEEWQDMNPNTKTSIGMHVSAVVNSFRTGIMRDLFTKGQHQTPDLILEKGKILIVDLPVKVHGESGRSANIAWKYCLQKAAGRRGKLTDKDRPTFIYGDEGQSFITPKDGEFAETSRGFRCISVYLTQNRANLLKKMTKDQVDSLMGNFVTKIFHQQSEKDTNEWASETIAKRLTERTSMGSSYQVGQPNQGGGSTNTSESAEYQLWPHEFQVLKTGGHKNKLLVQAWIFQGGSKTYPSNGNKTFAKVVFHQTHVVT